MYVGVYPATIPTQNNEKITQMNGQQTSFIHIPNLKSLETQEYLLKTLINKKFKQITILTQVDIAHVIAQKLQPLTKKPLEITLKAPYILLKQKEEDGNKNATPSRANPTTHQTKEGKVPNKTLHTKRKPSKQSISKYTRAKHTTKNKSKSNAKANKTTNN